MPKFRTLALVVALCAGTVATQSASQRAATDAASPVRATPAFTALVVAQRVDHVDTTAFEPMVVEHQSGALFVAGYGTPWAPRVSDGGRLQETVGLSRLWKSRDRGATWSRVDVGTGAKGVVGNSDVALAIGPEGTLYFVSMRYDSTSGKWEGRRISIGVSHDIGATWKWTALSVHRMDDRPWVRVAGDGVAHVIWNDGHGVLHTVSSNRGETWSTPIRIALKGGSSHLAVGPSGEVGIRLTPLSASGSQFDRGVDSILVSTDGGSTWRRNAAPGTRDWTTWVDPQAKAPQGSPTPRWVEPLAWDSAGRLYSLWTKQKDVRLARSADGGATWTEWSVATERHLAYYPYLVARGDGELAATWFTGPPDSLRWHIARITVSRDSAAPRVIRSAPLGIDAWSRDTLRANALIPDPGGEYLAATFLHDGTLGVATPLASPRRTGFTWWRFSAR